MFWCNIILKYLKGGKFTFYPKNFNGQWQWQWQSMWFSFWIELGNIAIVCDLCYEAILNLNKLPNKIAHKQTSWRKYTLPAQLICKRKRHQPAMYVRLIFFLPYLYIYNEWFFLLVNETWWFSNIKRIYTLSFLNIFSHLPQKISIVFSWTWT